MRKTRKQVFAEWLISKQSTVTAQQIMDKSKTDNLGVQVKTVNSTGSFVIKFSEKENWITPDEWLHNYLTVVKQRYEEAEAVYRSLFRQEHSEDKSPEPTIKSTSAWKQQLINKLNLERTADGIVFPADAVLGKKMIQHTVDSYTKSAEWKPATLVANCLRDVLSDSITIDPVIIEAVQGAQERKRNS